MRVEFLVETLSEVRALPKAEAKAMLAAFEKLKAELDQLPYPHSSQVQGTRLRELRPRAGRSPWRALYQRIGDAIVVAGICPEAQQDPRGFQRGITEAQDRLDRFREEHHVS